ATMEIVLSREIANRRIFPAVDISKSGTRREELLLSPETLRQVWSLRRMVSMVGDNEGVELMLARMARAKTNAEFLSNLNKRD
ncbi:MAG: transcription termination factor Rho, partial [Oscillochloris sp.]|nr:transcription termination factor Rho [Oscillochloris sp.]